jgi:hypothetical protein
MSSEVLTKFTLKFNDADLHTVYKREKTEFFSKSLLIASIMIGSLVGSVEVLFAIDGEKMGTLPDYIRIINGVGFLLLILTACLHQRWTFLHFFICPILTIQMFLYISFIDYDFTLGSIYYS